MKEMQMGIALARLFRKHAEFAYGAEGLPAVNMAQKILKWILGPFRLREQAFFTPREAQQGIRRLKSDVTDAPLRILEEINVIRQVSMPGKRLCVVNPYIFDGGQNR